MNRKNLILIPILIVSIGLLPLVQAVSPAPDGGYPNQNTAEGDNALLNLTSGANNTAVGFDTLLSNTTGNNNTATGIGALGSNTSGNDNTASGFGVLVSNTTGGDNTALGFEALFANTTGFQNTANGWRALFRNTIGFHNTADGFDALFFNTTGNHNTADGDIALMNNTTGNFNTASGAHTLNLNTTGNSNIALGFQAGSQLTTGSNNIDIGNVGVAAEADTIRIGVQGTHNLTFIAGINGAPIAAGAAVIVRTDGQLGVAGVSSARFKDEIKPMEKASEAILALKPVTFYYKKEIDPKRATQFGLVAEEVEKVNPALITRDADGKPYTVRYDQVNAMLLNEFLKEHRKVEQLTKDFESKLAQQQKQIEALSVGLQKVSAQHEASKPAPQVVNNP